jgi:hypothetical protein
LGVIAINSGGIGNGSASIILVFAVLCLTIFALISLSTAFSSKSLTDEAADMVVGYYRADTLAEEILARLTAAGEIPGSILGIDINTAQMEDEYGDPYTFVSYSCPVNDRKGLAVELKFNGEGFRVVSWCLINTMEWVPVNEVIISEDNIIWHN